MVWQTSTVIDRRTAVARLSAMCAGLAGVSCTPLRVGLRMYPERFDRDPALVDRTLRAFVLTVIPGLPEDDPNLVRHFYDDRFPVEPLRNFIAADLCVSADELCDTPAFDELPLERRTRVIQTRLSGGGTEERLYAGAILLTQVALYSGIYDDDEGCALIEFGGRSGIRGPAASTYSNPESFLPEPITVDGNPV